MGMPHVERTTSECPHCFTQRTLLARMKALVEEDMRTEQGRGRDR